MSYNSLATDADLLAGKPAAIALPTIRMMNVNRLTCLWPGLARLWFRGEWSGLALACGFAALANALIAATLLWPEVAPSWVCVSGFALAVIWWSVSAVWSFRELSQLTSSTPDDPLKGLFVSAQTEYLRGNWIEVEAKLRKLLRRRPRDVEAQLLLATLKRRTGQLDEARQQLQQLSKRDASATWRLELRVERDLLRQATEDRQQQDSETDSSDPHNGFEAEKQEEAVAEQQEVTPTDNDQDQPAPERGMLNNSQQRRAA